MSMGPLAGKVSVVSGRCGSCDFVSGPPFAATLPAVAGFLRVKLAS